MALIQSYPRFRATRNDGTPGNGWKLYTYTGGTTTLKATYTDQTGATANANPVIMDGAGEAAVWLGSGAYKLVLTDENDVVQWTLDNIQVAEGGYFTTLSATGAATFGSTISVVGQIISTVASPNPPLSIASTGKVANLNVDKLDDGDWTDLPFDPNDPTQVLLQARQLLRLVLKTSRKNIAFTSGPDLELQTDDGDTGLKGGDILLKPGKAASGTPGNIQTVGKDSTLQEIQKTVESGQWIRGHITEEITLNTGAAATDSVANLLPANALIEAIAWRITQTITTAANFTIGDSAQAARFQGTMATLTAGTTGIGLLQHNPANASNDLGPVQTAAAKLRITCNVAPGAGKIRVTVFYRQFVAPTS